MRDEEEEQATTAGDKRSRSIPSYSNRAQQIKRAIIFAATTEINLRCKLNAVPSALTSSAPQNNENARRSSILGFPFNHYLYKKKPRAIKLKDINFIFLCSSASRFLIDRRIVRKIPSKKLFACGKNLKYCPCKRTCILRERVEGRPTVHVVRCSRTVFLPPLFLFLVRQWLMLSRRSASENAAKSMQWLMIPVLAPPTASLPALRASLRNALSRWQLAAVINDRSLLAAALSDLKRFALNLRH